MSYRGINLRERRTQGSRSVPSSAKRTGAASMVKRPLDFLASRQGDRHDHLYSCAACGPASLRPDASRMPDFECDTGRVGFSLDQVDVYTRCLTCGDKVSVEC